jgi:glucose-6-phosphate 1-dehydrogenase
MHSDTRSASSISETLAQSHAPDLGLSPQACLIEGTLEPCIIVIFGASGDLTARKLVPALYNLFLNDALPRPFLILGCSRTAWEREVFQKKMEEAVRKAVTVDTAQWESFAACLYYKSVEYEKQSSFEELAVFLKALDEEHQTQGNRVFYLAIPPALYKTAAELLHRSGLSSERTQDKGWSRLIVEKPFGQDLETAKELDRSLHQGFREHQIFRIDHYLAKETVQNVLIFRFCNAIFEPIWNRSYIDYVGIIAAETLGVEHRAAYYDQSGVIRDMFQNHMMQLLALTAMEPPSVFEADRVQDKKVEVYRSLQPISDPNSERYLFLGQYGQGMIDGDKVPDYRDEPGVRPDTLTPTFAMMRLFIDNWRWRGVPFYVASGKRLAKKLTQIVIQFKEVPHFMFQNVLGQQILANRLTLGIYPQERITLTFQTKNPGATICLRSVTMDFDYYQNYSAPALEAYEKVLLDCIQGDHMLFWRQDGVELSWAFLTPILERCETCSDRSRRLHTYESGSWGPKAAEAWMKLVVGEGSNR